MIITITTYPDNAYTHYYSICYTPYYSIATIATPYYSTTISSKLCSPLVHLRASFCPEPLLGFLCCCCCCSQPPPHSSASGFSGRGPFGLAAELQNMHPPTPGSRLRLCWQLCWAAAGEKACVGVGVGRKQWRGLPLLLGSLLFHKPPSPPFKNAILWAARMVCNSSGSAILWAAPWGNLSAQKG